MTLDLRPVNVSTDTGLIAARLNLGARVVLIGAILFVEKFLLSFLVDFDAAQAATGAAAREVVFRLSWLMLHAALLVPLAALSHILYGEHSQIPFGLRAPLYLAVG